VIAHPVIEAPVEGGGEEDNGQALRGCNGEIEAPEVGTTAGHDVVEVDEDLREGREGGREGRGGREV